MRVVTALLLYALMVSADAQLVAGREASGRGDALSELAKTMSAGDWKELSTNNLTGMTLPNVTGGVNPGQSPTLEFTAEMLYDPNAGIVHFPGCARGDIDPAYQCDSFAADDAGNVKYTRSTNTWTRVTDEPGDDFTTAAHTYDRSAINPATGDRYHITSSVLNTKSIWKTTANVWEDQPYPSGVFDFNPALEFFPEMDRGRGGLVMVLGGSDANDGGGAGFEPKVCLRPGDTMTWRCSNLPTEIGYDQTVADWSDVRNLMYIGGGSSDTGGTGPVTGPCCDDALLTVDASGRVEIQESSPVPFGEFGASGKHVVNPCNGNLIVFDNSPKNIWEFDPSVTPDGAWTDVGDHPMDVGGGDMFAVFAPIPDDNVIMVLTAAPEKVWLYKPAGCE